MKSIQNFKLDDDHYSEIYPESCNPGKQWKRITEKRLRTFYTDVQNKGFYPEWKLIEYKNAGIELKMEDGDLETLKAGTVVILDFLTIQQVLLL